MSSRYFPPFFRLYDNRASCAVELHDSIRIAGSRIWMNISFMWWIKLVINDRNHFVIRITTFTFVVAEELADPGSEDSKII
jgi:hypothetical protein